MQLVRREGLDLLDDGRSTRSVIRNALMTRQKRIYVVQPYR